MVVVMVVIVVVVPCQPCLQLPHPEHVFTNFDIFWVRERLGTRHCV